MLVTVLVIAGWVVVLVTVLVIAGCVLILVTVFVTAGGVDVDVTVLVTVAVGPMAMAGASPISYRSPFGPFRGPAQYSFEGEHTLP